MRVLGLGFRVEGLEFRRLRAQGAVCGLDACSDFGLVFLLSAQVVFVPLPLVERLGFGIWGLGFGDRGVGLEV